MTYRVLYTEAAAKIIRKLDGAVKERIRKAIVRISEHPELGKHLTGLLKDRWSYRVGGWRILYKIRNAELIILILTIGRRSEIYGPD
ncbi:MAG: type II toxin-antitoxin system RelE/ParE family toxin [Elusimicrobia bacterium]|nr:type II toxin-antitoxin system RelE/ParE family toxin [Elusimicrobiota bacterium]